MPPDPFDSQDQNADAQATITRLSAEIERLNGLLRRDRFAQDLHNALTLAAATGTIAAPVTHGRLLEMIVETAAQVISARAASLFLLNEATQELTFEVALGEKASEAKKFTVPVGHGIAGLVAVSGQPMAISNAAQDSRQARDLADQIGYKPETILCVPLFYNDQIIGVLELLDKEQGTFTPADMDALGLFANMAAVAIEQSRTHRHLATLISDMVQAQPGVSPDARRDLNDRLPEVIGETESDATYQSVLELARLVQEIAQRGEREKTACHALLRGFADYLHTQPSQQTLGLGAL